MTDIFYISEHIKDLQNNQFDIEEQRNNTKPSFYTTLGFVIWLLSKIQKT